MTPFTVTGGKGATGTVVLNAPAPAGGLEVTVLSQHARIARGPATVFVPAGATTATFPIETFLVSVAAGASFRIVCNGVSTGASLRVRPS